MDGNIEEALALLLEGDKACLPEQEEMKGLVAASGRMVYCIEDRGNVIPAINLGRDIYSLVYSGDTLFATSDSRFWDRPDGEVFDVGRRMKIAKNNGAFIVPFRGSVAGVARDGKIMDFRKNEAIAYTECGKFSPLCSDGDRLFHADINGNVYDTLEHRAIGKLEERAWCLHPHNDDILAGTFKGVVSVRGNKTIDMPKERNGCVAQICTEGGRIFYLTLCDGAVYEATTHQKIIDFDVRCILADKGTLYAGTQHGKVIAMQLDGQDKAVTEIRKTNSYPEPVTAMAMVPMGLWEQLAGNNGRELQG